MHHGKYESPRPARRRRRRKSPGMLLISVVLLLCIATAGTIAFLQDATNKVENTFTPAHVEIEPSEDVDFVKREKSDIQFENTGDVPVYIRATLAIYWTDTFDTTDDGVDNPTEQTIAKPATAKIEGGTTLDKDWFRVGDIYYYSKSVAPGKFTSVMLDEITVTVPEGSTVQCHIDVHSEAIQAEPETAVGQAWPDVTVVDGKLTAKQGGQG